jgi:hypothetical protein
MIYNEKIDKREIRMGRKSELTQQKIDQICNKIKAEGNIPTVDRVRIEIGTGSRTTINQMIRKYEQNYKTDASVKRTAEMNMIFDTLIQETGKAYTAILSDLQSKLEDCNKKVQHYLSESEKHLDELESNQIKYQDLQEEKNRIQIQLENKDIEITRLQSKVDELSNINQLFKMLQIENEILKKQSNEKKDENITIKNQFESLMNVLLEKENQLCKRMDKTKKLEK